jgi:hypothetical protein
MGKNGVRTSIDAGGSEVMQVNPTVDVRFPRATVLTRTRSIGAVPSYRTSRISMANLAASLSKEPCHDSKTSPRR